MEILAGQTASGRSVAVGRGLEWITEGFGYFTKAPAVWIGITVVLGLLFVIGSIVPGSQLVLSLVTPVFSAGLLMGCADQQAGKPLTLAHLFAAFRGDSLWTLVLVGALALLAYVAIALVCVAVLFFTIGTAFLSGDSAAAAGIGFTGIALVALIALALAVPVAMATWFAAPLVVFRRLSAIDALKQSFSGCLRNIMPFLLYGILAFLMLLIAVIPFGLGLLVAFPVLVASVYLGYRDIYG